MVSCERATLQPKERLMLPLIAAAALILEIASLKGHDSVET
jgi:hypothetical protein